MAPSSPGTLPGRPTIAPLAPRTASLVRSATVVPSLASILQELVQNSIDAHAQSIVCSVDLDTWTLRCDDAGDGLPHSDLEQLSACTRHLTSKLAAGPHTSADDALAAVSSYGFRGEALASVSDLATVDIRTRARTGDGSTWELALRDGRCLAFRKSRLERTGCGTTVTARDIFHKLPVRRRPLTKPAAQAALLASLRSTLASLALLHPHIAFSLSDTTTSLSSLSSEPRTLLSVARSTEGLVGRWRQLWGRAGVEKVWEFDEAEPDAEGDHGKALHVRGFFSLSAAHTKAGQHVFVNSRPLAASTSALHKHLNALFAQSSFARFAVSHLSTPSASPAKKGAKSPRRAAERHPVFVLALSVPGRVVDVSLEPEKRVVEFEDPGRIEHFITQLTKRFLTLHGFLHVATGPPPAVPPPTSPSASRKRTRIVEVGDAQPGKRAATLDASRLAPEPGPTPRRAPPRMRSASATAPVVCPSIELAAQGDEDNDTDAPPVRVPMRWVDPATREVWLVDRRTGNSRREACEGCRGHRSQRDDAERVDRSALKRARGEQGEVEVELPEWLRRSLENWDNPIFPSAPVARAIPSLPPLPVPTALGPAAATLPDSFRATKRSLPASSSQPASAAALSRAARAGVGAFCATVAPASGPEVPALARLGTPGPVRGGGVSAPVTRAQLAAAEFVAQVDAKYLLVRVPAVASPTACASSDSGDDARPAGTILVLVDQHAASERVRVERAYAAVAGAVARGTQPATAAVHVGVVVSAGEYAAVRDRWQPEFARWGVEVDLAPGAIAAPDADAGAGAYRQLVLTAVPAALAARLASAREPHLAQALVRSFVAQLDEAGPAPRSSSGFADAGDEAGWVAMLRHAPRVVKDLLDSRACRGAVMFNDVLSDDQARQLVRQLAETVFPGQCAHGRPSMVPVVRFAAAGAAQRDDLDWSRLG
ncbi:hypothetical protein JCM3770_001889 [Rhodotorula araucariae]